MLLSKRLESLNLWVRVLLLQVLYEIKTIDAFLLNLFKSDSNLKFIKSLSRFVKVYQSFYFIENINERILIYKYDR